MPDQISVTFLGTAAGKPCPTRNVSSLALKLDRAIWVVDAGEGTQHQFMNEKCRLKMAQITKIFVTHMHADHIMGLPGLLCTISAGEGGVLPGEVDPRLAKASTTTARPTEIFGPKGLRAFIRQSLSSTYSILSRPYMVTELLFPDETPSLEPSDGLHPNERAGRDVFQKDGIWKSFDSAPDVDISAGPILHTAPCIGYIFTENPRPLPIVAADYLPHLLRPINALALTSQGIRDPRSLLSTLTRERKSITLEDGTILLPPTIGGPGRKIVILGDTYDATGCAGLARDADLVVHEATNAFLPNLDETQRRPGITLETVRETAKAHGHSTPEGAGEFAKLARAKALVLNHLSVKYPFVDDEEKEEDSEATKNKRSCLREIERLASAAWGGGKAKLASDFMIVEVKAVKYERPQSVGG